MGDLGILQGDVIFQKNYANCIICYKVESNFAKITIPKFWVAAAAKVSPQREAIPYICDFSRGGLNVRLTAHIQTLLRGHKYRV